MAGFPYIVVPWTDAMCAVPVRQAYRVMFTYVVVRTVVSQLAPAKFILFIIKLFHLVILHP